MSRREASRGDHGGGANAKPAAPASEPVAFFIPYADDVRDKDPFVDLGSFTNGATIWIAATYHHLNRRGLPVVLRSERPEERIVVVHPDHIAGLERTLGGRHRPLVVVTRADRVPHPRSDAEIVQNPALSETMRKFPLTHWPQPGLVPRDAARGERITTVTYKGSPKNLHPLFMRPEWTSELAQLGIRWAPDLSVQRTDGVDRKYDASWHDYSQADLVLAVRPNLAERHFDKPSHKLINAWRAGVPLIAGPESGYTAICGSELDFVLVREPGEVLDQIRKLVADPARYLAMIEHGRRRAEEYTFDAIAQEWVHVLWHQVLALVEQPESTTARRARLAARRIVSIANNRVPLTRRLVSLW